MHPSSEVESGNTYTVNVNVNNKYNIDLSAVPTPLDKPRPADFQKEVNFKFKDSDAPVDPLARHVTQDVVGSKFRDSHFRPCLPNEGPLPSGCTPRNIWRPCWPAEVLSSGKRSRTFDKLGSSWPSQPSSRDHDSDMCSFNRDWVIRAAKPPNTRRAGKLSDIKGSLLFPGAKIITRKPIQRPYGKNVGDTLPRFKSRPGDVLILPCISSTFEGGLDPRGYVGFLNNSYGFEMEGGVLLLRVIKFRDSKLHTRKKLKLFLKATDQQWRLKGMLHTHGYLQDPCDGFESNYKSVPVRYRAPIRSNTSDLQCIPQRGDVIIREPWKDLLPYRHDHQACLMWWRPKLELDINDILVRTCVWHCCDDFEGFVDLFYYNGKGIRWVFLGRDETIYDTATLGADSDTSDDEKT